MRNLLLHRPMSPFFPPTVTTIKKIYYLKRIKTRKQIANKNEKNRKKTFHRNLLTLLHKWKHMPGLTLPARPFLCSKLVFEAQTVA